MVRISRDNMNFNEAEMTNPWILKMDLPCAFARFETFLNLWPLTAQYPGRILSDSKFLAPTEQRPPPPGHHTSSKIYTMAAALALGFMHSLAQNLEEKKSKCAHMCTPTKKKLVCELHCLNCNCPPPQASR